MMGWTLFHVIKISKRQKKEEEESGEIEGLPLSILVLAMIMMSLNLLQFFRNRALRFADSQIFVASHISESIRVMTLKSNT